MVVSLRLAQTLRSKKCRLPLIFIRSKVSSTKPSRMRIIEALPSTCINFCITKHITSRSSSLRNSTRCLIRPKMFLLTRVSLLDPVSHMMTSVATLPQRWLPPRTTIMPLWRASRTTIS